MRRRKTESDGLNGWERRQLTKLTMTQMFFPHQMTPMDSAWLEKLRRRGQHTNTLPAATEYHGYHQDPKDGSEPEIERLRR